jgi:hypothetical protein
VHWLVTATGAGLVGLAIGALLMPLFAFVLAPMWRRMRPT